jgi:hypothetical protein
VSGAVPLDVMLMAIVEKTEGRTMVRIEGALKALGNAKLVVQVESPFEWALCELDGFGRFEARLMWSNKRPKHPQLVGLEVSKYSKDYGRLIALMEQHGVTIKKGADVVLGLSDDDKNAIYSALKLVYENFVNDLLNGKIKVTTITVGHDYVHAVPHAEGDYENFRTRDLLYYYVGELAGAWGKWSNCPEGHDITDEVIEVVKRAIAPREQGGDAVVCWECGRRFTYEQARRMVARGEASWDGPTGFYCGC